MAVTPDSVLTPARIFVRFSLTDEARRRLAREGKAAPRETSVEYEFTTADEAWVRLAGVAELNDSGSLLLRLTRQLDQVPMTPAEAVAAYEAEIQAQADEQAAWLDGVRDDVLSQTLTWLETLTPQQRALPEIQVVIQGMAVGVVERVSRTGAHFTMPAPLLASAQVPGFEEALEAVEADKALARARAWVQGLEPEYRALPEVEALEASIAERRTSLYVQGRVTKMVTIEGHGPALNAVGEAQREAERAAAIRDAEEWVRQHGSPRLQRILAEGFLAQSGGVLRDEQLAKERPGWEWASDATSGERILNPTTEALDLLDEARRTTGGEDVRLVWLSQAPAVLSRYRGQQIILRPRPDAEAVAEADGSEG